MTADLTVLSLGGGVQSSALLLMACAGQLGPLDAAVFADTGGEMPETYEYLDYLRGHAERAGVRLLTVSAGDLRVALVARYGRGGQPTLPVRLRHPDGSVGRLNHYRCSYDFKRRPVARAVKQLCGPPGAWKRARVEQWIGYSTDEISRVKPAEQCRCGHNRVRRAVGARPFAVIHTAEGCTRCSCRTFDPWQVNRWPLIDLGLSRVDCLDWLRSHGHPDPPRSACFFCPNRPPRHWAGLRREHPKLYREAVTLDEFVRHGINALRAEAFLHPTARPLAGVHADGDPAGLGDDAGEAEMDCEAGVCFT